MSVEQPCLKLGNLPSDLLNVETKNIESTAMLTAVCVCVLPFINASPCGQMRRGHADTLSSPKT